MEGHFYKRGDKWTFVLDLSIDPLTGKRKQKSKGGFKTKKEAQIAVAALTLELSNGTYVKEKDILFKDFTAEW